LKPTPALRAPSKLVVLGVLLKGLRAAVSISWGQGTMDGYKVGREEEVEREA